MKVLNLLVCGVFLSGVSLSSSLAANCQDADLLLRNGESY